MSNKILAMFVLILALIPAESLAQETPARKFDGGYFNAGIRSTSTNKQIALFFDPSRTTFPAPSNRDELFKSVAANASDLTRVFDLIPVVTDNNLIKGLPAKGMLHIALSPVQGTSVIDKTLIEDPETSQPAALKSLQEVKAKFGEPTEQELWSQKIAHDLGLNGVVYWWGGVGVAADARGSITHVLLRTEPKK